MHSDILTSEAVAYFYFKSLPDEIKQANKIKPAPKFPRLDCTLSYNPINWQGFDYCIIETGKDKNRLYWQIKEPFNINGISDKRLPKHQIDKYAKGKPNNISGLFVEHKAEGLSYGYGYFNKQQLIGLNKDRPNPFYIWRGDLFLFITNDDFSFLEILIIKEARYNYIHHLKKLVLGEYNTILDQVREKSTPFYEYKNLEQRKAS